MKNLFYLSLLVATSFAPKLVQAKDTSNVQRKVLFEIAPYGSYYGSAKGVKHNYMSNAGLGMRWAYRGTGFGFGYGQGAMYNQKQVKQWYAIGTTGFRRSSFYIIGATYSDIILDFFVNRERIEGGYIKAGGSYKINNWLSGTAEYGRDKCYEFSRDESNYNRAIQTDSRTWWFGAGPKVEFESPEGFFAEATVLLGVDEGTYTTTDPENTSRNYEVDMNNMGRTRFNRSPGFMTQMSFKVGMRWGKKQ